MFNFTVDLGQVLLGALIAIIGWFVKRTIDKFDNRIEKHEMLIYEMSGNIKHIQGILNSRRAVVLKMTNYFDIVVASKQQLEAEGHVLSGPSGDQALSDELKGLLTARSAYNINKINPNIGLMSKPGGANYHGVSTDTLLDRSNGDATDMATTNDNGTTFTVVPIWNPGAPEDVNRWVQPTKELAQIGDGPVDPGDDELIKQLIEILTNIQEMQKETLDAVDRIETKVDKLLIQTSHFKLLGMNVTIYPDVTR